MLGKTALSEFLTVKKRLCECEIMDPPPRIAFIYIRFGALNIYSAMVADAASFLSGRVPLAFIRVYLDF